MDNKIIFEGYRYKKHRSAGRSTVYRCEHKQSKLNINCPGMGRVVNGIFRKTVEHKRHHADNNLIIISEFKKKLKEASTLQLRPPKEIYDDLIMQYPAATQLVSLKNAIQIVNDRRKKVPLPEINELIDVYEVFSRPSNRNLLVHHHGTLKIRYEENILIIGDDVIINSLNADECDKLYISSLCSSTPLGVRDTHCMITITMPYKRYAIPIGWIITNERSEVNINTGIQLFFIRFGIGLVPDNIYYDFEQKLDSALTNFYPNSIKRGSFSSFCELNLESLRRFGVIINDDTNGVIVMKLICISLLPSNRILEGFEYIKQGLLNNPYINVNILEQFCNYFFETWIEGVGIDHLSFYQDVNAFGDLIDSHHGALSSTMTMDGNFWQFIKFCLKTNMDTYDLILKLGRNKKPTTFPKIRTSSISISKLRKIWELIGNKRIGVDSFVAAAAFILKSFILDKGTVNFQKPHDFAVRQFIGPRENRQTANNPELDLDQWHVNLLRNPDNLRPRRVLQRPQVENGIIFEEIEEDIEEDEEEEDGMEAEEINIEGNQNLNREDAGLGMNPELQIHQRNMDNVEENDENENPAIVAHDPENNNYNEVINNPGIIAEPEEIVGPAEIINPNQENLGERWYGAPNNICLLCQSMQTQVKFLPCRHFISCNGCWDDLREASMGNTICPICRAIIVEIQ